MSKWLPSELPTPPWSARYYAGTRMKRQGQGAQGTRPERQCQSEVGAPFGIGVFGALVHAIFIAASPIVSGSG